LWFLLFVLLLLLYWPLLSSNIAFFLNTCDTLLFTAPFQSSGFLWALLCRGGDIRGVLASEAPAISGAPIN